MASQTRLDQIRDLVNQWEQLVGYSVTVPDSAVNDMANNQWASGAFGLMGPVMTLFDVGMYMGARAGGGGLWNQEQLQAMPWAEFGMAPSQYYSMRDLYSSQYESLTGQGPADDSAFGALLAGQKGQLTSGTIQTALINDKNLQATFGWIKYGLDYSQFITQKLQMESSLGHSLTDQAGAVQLQFMHAAQGPNMAVGPQQTLTQVERKQVQTGVGQSEIR